MGASLNIGFSACGIARANKVDEKNAQAFRTWIQSGKNASMQYMENYEEKRLDPRLLLPGAKSIIVVAL
ncbi:MAG: tRNA epoxyqueuosine(34) reductase QueG, partial [Bacteroidaceae bacterium]|nr:tRNA epoxyqueuosine(34) reductase QueG [Bacteroidaceae bacterium]